VAQSLHYIKLGMTRAFAVSGERTVLVDAGQPGDGPRILAALARFGIAPRDVSLIVLTHAHVDHYGGLRFLKEATGAPVAVGRADAAFLVPGTGPPLPVGSFVGRLLLKLVPRHEVPGELAVVPEVLVEEALDLASYGVEARVIATPGHTRGSLSVLLPTGEALVGDLVMRSLMVFGTPAIAFFAQDKPESRRSLRTVLDCGARAVVSTHGGAFAPEEIRRHLLGEFNRPPVMG
jgi:glyoxylase-like metal-dependent hydrolase (beta-lactamase superfamily II)